MTTVQPLLIELFVEELPPKALKLLGEGLAHALREGLHARGLLATPQAEVTAFASPRRLAVHISAVLAQAPDLAITQKLMPVHVGLDAQGQASAALHKKMVALGVAPEAVTALVPTLRRATDGKTEALFWERVQSGVSLTVGLQQALDKAVTALPIPKLMRYQLSDGWTNVSFVRPVHGLVALHGSQVVPVSALGRTAGRETQGHRFEARQSPVVLKTADSYAQQLFQEGAVWASFEQRRAEISRQLQAAAQVLGLSPVADEALLDEVTALVERPHVLTCCFDAAFLDVPPECLILTMKANQKYFPLLSPAGDLTPYFLVVSNITPDDPRAVIEGNERVVRSRLADAQFFYTQDRKRTLASRVPSLSQVVYHHQLGSQGDRVQRVRAVLDALLTSLDDARLGAVQRQTLCTACDQAAQWAKADLLTDMVGEFPELQGIMGAYYARHDGASEDVAQAIEDHYKPRFAGDVLPRTLTGQLLALADKLETLVGLLGIGQLPTGDKDPFALRRHALGVVRLLIEQALPLPLDRTLQAVVRVFGDRIQDPTAVLTDFIEDRLGSYLREQGFAGHEVEAVMALRPQRLDDLPARLQAVRHFVALPEAVALAAANKRVANILKKTPMPVRPVVNAHGLKVQEEVALFEALQTLEPQSRRAFEAGDYTASLCHLAMLRVPVDRFFDGVMVNSEDAALRANRLGLLAQLHGAMNQVADLSRLVV